MARNMVISERDFIKKINFYFSTEDPVKEIHSELKKMINIGYNRNYLYKLLCKYRIYLQNEKRWEEEDIIVNVLTFFVGWCTPDWKL